MPVDNPTTHLELTMIHEGMVLEYSGPSLALVEWASAIKLHAMLALLIALFCPWGMASGGSGWGIAVALAPLLCKNRVPHGSAERDRERRGQAADVPGSGFPWRGLRAVSALAVIFTMLGEEVTRMGLVGIATEKSSEFVFRLLISYDSLAGCRTPDLYKRASVQPAIRGHHCGGSGDSISGKAGRRPTSSARSSL